MTKNTLEVKFRCDCPFTSAIDILGDKWMLVIVKQMLVDGKKTFKDFIASDEAIATNILTVKLKLLEELGLIMKTKLPNNKKTNIYLLTDQGLTLTPILVELASWSDTNLREMHPLIQDGPGMELLRKDKASFARMIEEAYRTKRNEFL
jgi:DNA-binding HxlR family transcriptional regulator